MTAAIPDVRYALRALLHQPLYAFVTVVVLALAIGANATVFSVFNGFFLRPLPYPDGERLVMVHNSYPGLGLEMAGTSIPDYLDRREQAGSLEELAIYTFAPRALGGEAPERIQVVRASPSLFGVLGVAPARGRAFTEDEATPGNDHVVLLSHALWRSRFGSRLGLVGEDVRLDGEPYRVVGIMPEGFGFPSREFDAWMPFAFTPAQTSDEERGREFSMSVGRLRPGATVEALTAELDAIVRRNLEAGRFGDGAGFIDTTGFTGRARLARDMAVGDLAPMLLILQGIVLAVLLIACANVANLQLARMIARRKELSVRAALGAGRARLARLVLTESLVLALCGAGAGIALGHAGLALVRSLGLDFSAQGFEFVLDLRVVVFTAGLALIAAVLSALLPLLAVLREDLARAVQEAGRLGSGGRRTHRFRSALAVVQIAISVALLSGAGVLTKSFYRLQQTDAGFDTENVWTARIAIPETRYADTVATARFYETVLEELESLPGVVAAGFTSTLPFDGTNAQGSYMIDGFTPRDDASPPHGQHRTISEGYLPALGIPVTKGRNFHDNENQRVAIVDEVFANRFFPDGNVLGQRIREDVESEWFTIVGVVPAVKQASLSEDPSKETIYWNYKQEMDRAGMLAVRSTLPPDQLTRTATAAVLTVDRDVPLSDVKSLDARIAGSLGPQRAPMVLTLVFAGVAFTLAVIGIYGVLTWAVTERHGEIGVRMALGARGADIVRMVIGQGGRMTVAGLAVGLVGALALGRVLASQIYEVNPFDPAVLGIAIIGLLGAAMLASWLPARRASRVDPMRALRDE